MKAKVIKEGDDLQEFGLFLKDGSVAAGQAGEAGLGQKFIPSSMVKVALTPEKPRTDKDRLDWLCKQLTVISPPVTKDGYIHILRDSVFLVNNAHQLRDSREAIDYCMDMELGAGE